MKSRGKNIPEKKIGAIGVQCSPATCGKPAQLGGDKEEGDRRGFWRRRQMPEHLDTFRPSLKACVLFRAQ